MRNNYSQLENLLFHQQQSQSQITATEMQVRQQMQQMQYQQMLMTQNVIQGNLNYGYTPLDLRKMYEAPIEKAYQDATNVGALSASEERRRKGDDAWMEKYGYVPDVEYIDCTDAELAAYMAGEERHPLHA